MLLHNNIFAGELAAYVAAMPEEGWPEAA